MIKIEKYDFTIIMDTMIDFLDNYGSPTILGNKFYEIIKGKNGKNKFFNLLKASGYHNDPEGFFKEIFHMVFKTNNEKIKLNDIELPSIILVPLLEIIIPGTGYFSIKNIRELRQNFNIELKTKNFDDLNKVIEKYPVRLSKHIIRQSMVSMNVAYQYIPFVEELDSIGHTNTWVGQFQDGLIEQMYPNRVIFLLNMTCPVYCRFCFRKHKNARNETPPGTKDVRKAVNYVKRSPLIKEILITGGDPFLNKKNLRIAIDGLNSIDHVKTLRLATRSIAYYPELFLKNNSSYLNFLKDKNLELQENNKIMEIATHFVHPDEVSIESLKIITQLIKSGIKVYVQTPFLNNCNDRGDELVRLFTLLRGAGAEIHYIFMPCSPIHGNSIYWTSLSRGINIAKYLRKHLSDRAIPKMCTATPIGKIEWHSSGWVVEKVKEKQGFIWIRTPYTPEFFKSFAPDVNKLDNIRLNKEGTFDVQYMADQGEDSLCTGSRTKPEKEKFKKIDLMPIREIKALKLQFYNENRFNDSIIATNIKNLKRLHKTRVEININAKDEVIKYIMSDKNITDLIISSNLGKIDFNTYIKDLKILILKLRCIDHLNSIRLRILQFAFNINAFSDLFIKDLGKLNHLDIDNPLRIEIETWFITGEDITENHGETVQKLNNQGISVYCNTPLLGRINDTPDIILELSYALRKVGIEFHHLYISGLPIQTRWNKDHLIDSANIIDIASKVRAFGSGREIPQYIVLTPSGELDFDLRSSELENLWDRF